MQLNILIISTIIHTLRCSAAPLLRCSAVNILRPLRLRDPKGRERKKRVLGSYLLNITLQLFDVYYHSLIFELMALARTIKKIIKFNTGRCAEIGYF
jgi:hypothetical protein